MSHNALPEAGYVRLWQIVGKPNAIPPVPAIIPVSKSTWWDGVKTGRFPKPVKLGPRVTVWRVEDIRALIASPSTPPPASATKNVPFLTC